MTLTLWEIMEQKGISQYQLLKRAIDNKTLDSLKKNKNITLNTLEKMSKILEVEPYEIFQNISTTSNEEMYNYLIQKIETLKNNTSKLKLLCDLFKILL